MGFKYQTPIECRADHAFTRVVFSAKNESYEERMDTAALFEAAASFLRQRPPNVLLYQVGYETYVHPDGSETPELALYVCDADELPERIEITR